MNLVSLAPLTALLNQVAGEALRRKQQRAPRHVDGRMVHMQPVPDRSGNLLAKQHVRQMHVGEEDAADAAQTPKEDEELTVLRGIGQHGRRPDRRHKVESDGVSRPVDQFSAGPGNVE